MSILSARSSQTKPPSTIAPHRSNTDMEFRDSFSRLKKKVKRRLTGSKQNKTGSDVCGETVESTGPRAGSDPRVVIGRRPQPRRKRIQRRRRSRPFGDSTPSTGWARFCARTWGGGVSDRERRGTDVDRREVEREHSHLHPADVEVAEGGGPAEGKDIDWENVKRVHPSPSTIPILHDRKPDSE